MKQHVRHIAVAWLLAILPQAGEAQSICRIYEYAELKDMSQAKLLEMRCEYYSDMVETVNAALDNIKAGRTAASQRDQRDGNRCAQEMTRMENVLESKFGMKEFPKCARAQPSK